VPGAPEQLADLRVISAGHLLSEHGDVVDEQAASGIADRSELGCEALLAGGCRPRWKWLATVASVHLWDDTRWEAISEHHVQLARETGALGELPLALSQRVYMHLFAGELTAAASLVDEAQAATEATGSNLAPYGAPGLVALRGREAEATSLIDSSRAAVTQRGEGIGISVLDWAEAVLHNGLGRYEEALAAARRVTEHPRDLSSSNWGRVELIEAAVRAGTRAVAADALRRLVEMARASGTDWALGLSPPSCSSAPDPVRAIDPKLLARAGDRIGNSSVITSTPTTSGVR
jgi:hypothetical protein